MKPFVVVVTATWRRALELDRLLKSLEKSDPAPDAVLVVDNADDPETDVAVRAACARLNAVRLVPGENLGCGGGLAYGERVALEHFDAATHLWMLDDDTEVAPDALQWLLAAMQTHAASLACPLITDAQGHIGWFPGLLDRTAFDAIRTLQQTPAKYVARCGPDPIRFSWSTGVSLLATRQAIEAFGTHRSDFWIRGEDLDFSLRLTFEQPGIFVPAARVAHLPPAAGVQTPETTAAERIKHALMLQNIAYISLHLPYGRRILRSFPGNIRRYLKTWSLGSIPELLRALWLGGVLGRPAGVGRKARMSTIQHEKAADRGEKTTSASSPLSLDAGAWPMKLLVFAHTPPPHHGQSVMVKLMLDGFEAETSSVAAPKIKCYHVNCRVSDDMEDIDTVRFGKLILVLRYCLQALWYRYRYGIGALYYVPAPGKRSALYRDWIVMALCRPFFKKVIFHWHATGLGDWLSQNGSRTERWITQMLLGRPALSIALANTNLRDVTWLHSRKVEIIPNGIPDPCPEFFQEILPGRIARAQERKQSLETPKPGQAPLIFRCLYLAHCIREKGLFDTLEGVALFNQRRPQLRVHLTVAGAFMNKKEEQEFHDRITQPDLVGGVTYAGFISGPAKKSLLSESDCICFPTYYSAESFGLTLVEAMAFGIPSVTTRWRAIPEVMPPDYPCYVAPKSPPEIAEALERLAGADLSAVLRKHFLANLGVQSHIQQMAAAMIGVGME